MLQLEGKMTDEKEALIISEQEKYDKAFSEIERIDSMTANGKISENAADGLKAELYAVTFSILLLSVCSINIREYVKMEAVLFMIPVICICLG